MGGIFTQSNLVFSFYAAGGIFSGSGLSIPDNGYVSGFMICDGSITIGTGVNWYAPVTLLTRGSITMFGIIAKARGGANPDPLHIKEMQVASDVLGGGLQ